MVLMVIVISIISGGSFGRLGGGGILDFEGVICMWVDILVGKDVA